MFSKQMSFEDALEFVQTKRPLVNPNDGFQFQLVNYDQELQALRKQ
jgi:hypothetical protein